MPWWSVMGIATGEWGTLLAPRSLLCWYWGKLSLCSVLLWAKSATVAWPLFLLMLWLPLGTICYSSVTLVSCWCALWLPQRNYACSQKGNPGPLLALIAFGEELAKYLCHLSLKQSAIREMADAKERNRKEPKHTSRNIILALWSTRLFIKWNNGSDCPLSKQTISKSLQDEI